MRVPEPANHAERLRFQTQERFMQTALRELQERLEHWLREASFQRSINIAASAQPLQRCRELQSDYDSLACELVQLRVEHHGAHPASEQPARRQPA